MHYSIPLLLAAALLRLALPSQPTPQAPRQQPSPAQTRVRDAEQHCVLLRLPRPDAAAAPPQIRPAAKILVAPAAFRTDFADLEAQAGGGPYDVILVAVRSRLPFAFKDGGPPAQREVHYAEALCRRNGDPNLKLLFQGVPLRVENDGQYAPNQYLRTQTTGWADAAPTDGPDGALWEAFGTPTSAVAKYRTTNAGSPVYPYPHAYQFEAPTVEQALYQQQEPAPVYEYKLKYEVPMLAKLRAPGAGFVRTTDPRVGEFRLLAPKAKQILVFPDKATRADGTFRQTAPPGAVIYAGTGAPTPDEVFGVFRAYAWQSAMVRHHVPGKPAQRWLFVTVDETAGLVGTP